MPGTMQVCAATIKHAQAQYQGLGMIDLVPTLSGSAASELALLEACSLPGSEGACGVEVSEALHITELKM